MQKTLLIIRHAKAKEIKIGQADFERKLSKKGIGHANTMANILEEIQVKPDKIYASPAQRTKMTAEIFAETLQHSLDNLVFKKDIYEASSNTLLDIVTNFDDHVQVAFIVGHNPGVTLLADDLTEAGVDFIPTCGMALITFEIDSWRMVSRGLGSLVWLKKPKMI